MAGLAIPLPERPHYLPHSCTPYIVQDWDVGPNTLHSFWVALSGFPDSYVHVLVVLKTLSPICCRWFKLAFPRTFFGMLRWHEIPAGQELEEPVGLLGGLEPPHRRRRLSKGRDLPPPLLPLTFAACVPTKATTIQFPPLAGTGGVFFLVSEREKLVFGGSLLLRVEVQSRQAWSIVSTARRKRAGCAAGTVRKAPDKSDRPETFTRVTRAEGPRAIAVEN